MRFLFLIGPPGSGKTVCGQELARQLDCLFFDTDQLIEQAHGSSVATLFASHGEQHFRQLETELIEFLPDQYAEEQRLVVFATGGGLPIYNENLQRLRQLGEVVALSASLPVLVERVKTNSARPLLATSGENADEQLQRRLAQLLETRSPVYDQARYKIDTSGLKPEQVAHEIIEMIFGKR